LEYYISAVFEFTRRRVKSAFKKMTAVWEQAPFRALFADPFAEGNELEGAHHPAEALRVSDVHLPWNLRKCETLPNLDSNSRQVRLALSSLKPRLKGNEAFSNLINCC